MNVSIITSLYNRLDLTRVYLESLERTLASESYEVIFVDDGSTDGTREFLATLPETRYRVRFNDSPRGYAANNNAAARIAQAPLLCLLNNDTSLLPGWLEPMTRMARWNPRAAMVGNVQREPVSGLIDHYGVYFNPANGRPLHAGKNRAYAPRESYLAWPAVTAACCVIRRSLFAELGGFDEEFRNGFEDIDLCLRAGERGYRHYVANRSVIYHHVSASPNRRRHEDENLALFRARWRGRVPVGLPPFAAVDDLHAEGSRYLRKHLARPWRYNLWRFCRALEQRLAPWPAASRPALPLRWALKLAGAAGSPPAPPARTLDAATPIFLVVQDTVHNPGRSGIQTVVRSLAAALGRAGTPVRTVIWKFDSDSLYLLPPTLSAGLAAEPLRDVAASDRPLHELGIAPAGWVLMPELMFDDAPARLVDYVHRHGLKLAVIFHDAIAVCHPEFVPPSLPERYAGYLRDFSRADLILPNSETSAKDWHEYVAKHGLAQPPVRVCVLASDVSGTPRVRAEDLAPAANDPARPVRLLCVSTIEPRKNHRGLLAAYELAAAARPGLRLELSLVGAPYVGADALADEVRRFVARHPGVVTWHKQVEYSLLRRLYEEADFTVYPSVMEGFGLPIIESLWFGRPCVCANFGVMSENAAGGGCITVDVCDPQALSNAVLLLADSPAKRRELALAATKRRLKTWDEYAAEVLGSLQG